MAPPPLHIGGQWPSPAASQPPPPPDRWQRLLHPHQRHPLLFPSPAWRGAAWHNGLSGGAGALPHVHGQARPSSPSAAASGLPTAATPYLPIGSIRTMAAPRRAFPIGVAVTAFPSPPVQSVVSSLEEKVCMYLVLNFYALGSRDSAVEQTRSLVPLVKTKQKNIVPSRGCRGPTVEKFNSGKEFPIMHAARYAMTEFLLVSVAETCVRARTCSCAKRELVLPCMHMGTCSILLVLRTIQYSQSSSRSRVCSLGCTVHTARPGGGRSAYAPPDPDHGSGRASHAQATRTRPRRRRWHMHGPSPGSTTTRNLNCALNEGRVARGRYSINRAGTPPN